jgi:hypothetical protein
MKKYSKKWWKEWFIKSSIRALFTFSQGLLGMTIVDVKELLNLDWIKILLTCLIMALLSYAKSIVVGMPELEESNE